MLKKGFLLDFVIVNTTSYFFLIASLMQFLISLELLSGAVGGILTI